MADMEPYLNRFRIKLPSKSRQSPSKNVLPETTLPNRSPSTLSDASGTSPNLSDLGCKRCHGEKLCCDKSLPENLPYVRDGISCSLCQGDTEPHDEVNSLLGATQRNPNSVTYVATPLQKSSVIDIGSSQQSSTDAHAVSEILARKRARIDDDTTHSQARGGVFPYAVNIAPECPSPYRMVDAYFQDFQQAYPFVDRRRVLSTLQTRGSSLFEAPDRDVDSTMAYLVAAIGYMTLLRAGKLTGAVHFSFQVNYKVIISNCLVEESIDTVERLLLLSIFSVIDPNSFSTWSIVDIVARQATRLGLTQRATAEKGYTQSEIERNRRLFWSVFSFDRAVAASIGMSPAMTDVNTDIPLPSVTAEDLEIFSNVGQTPKFHITRHLIELRILEGRILSEIHLREYRAVEDLSLASKRAIIHGLLAEVEDWYNRGCLMKPPEPDEITMHVRHSWLAARYYNLLLLLYFPSCTNPGTAMISRDELVSIAQKHVQATVVRFRKKQLPLNHLTLCRLLQVVLIFLHFTILQKPQDDTLNAREEIDICADILAAYPIQWTLAHRASAVVHQMISIPSARMLLGDEHGTEREHNTTSNEKAKCQSVKLKFYQLMQQIAVCGSQYLRIDHWEGNLSDNQQCTMEQNDIAGHMCLASESQCQSKLPSTTLLSLPGAGVSLDSVMGRDVNQSGGPYLGSIYSQEIEGAVDFPIDVNYIDFL